MATSSRDALATLTPDAAETRLTTAQRRLDEALRRFSLPLLRISLGVVFVWFGALKIFDATPIKELVAATVPWMDPDWFVPALGAFEIAVGLGLVVGYRLGWVCAVVVAHLGGTFFTLVMEPSALFTDGNPLMLTMEGEFVAKNLVLITAVLVVAAWARKRAAGSPGPFGSSRTDPRPD